MILVVDNYDSFVFNLVHYLEILGEVTLVLKNDDPRLANPEVLNAKAMVISPGPCTPEESGYCVPLIRQMAPSVPILGVCLGHQCIGTAFGIPVLHAPVPVHGQSSEVYHEKHPLFSGISNPFSAARYHSLVLPERGSDIYPLDLIAWTETGINMGIAHCQYPTYGVQFHPESILTHQGMALIGNFLTLTKAFYTPKNAYHE